MREPDGMAHNLSGESHPHRPPALILSDEVEGVLHRALAMACEAGHAELTPEHVALELLFEDDTSTYLMRCGTDLVAVEARLREHLAGAEANSEADADAQPGPELVRLIEAATERAEDEGRENLMLRGTARRASPYGKPRASRSSSKSCANIPRTRTEAG